MHTKIPAVFNWSGGKDSALALYRILQEDKYQVCSLLTTINRDTRRSSMHGIPIELLHRQADSLGLPLQVIELPSTCSMLEYETAMKNVVSHFQNHGISHFIFGDICLEEVRSYREKQLAPLGITLVEPLWGKETKTVAEEFLMSGLQTMVITTDANLLNEKFVGRIFDRAFLAELPSNVDPCGENGEFHTFCFAGGMFRTSVEFSVGEPRRYTYPIKLDDGTVKDCTYCYVELSSNKV